MDSQYCCVEAECQHCQVPALQAEIERLRGLVQSIARTCNDQLVSIHQLEAEVERLRAVCGSMDDPSRTSKFELSEDGTQRRTVTYTAWRPA